MPNKTYNLLIVEDSSVMLKMLTHSLENFFAISTAGSVSDALKVLDAKSIQIVLLDLVLPNGEGLAVVRKFQSSAPEIPTGVLTGYDFETTKLIHAGAHFVIRKPPHIPTLIDALVQAVARHEVRWQMIPVQDEISGIKSDMDKSAKRLDEAAKTIETKLK